MGYCQYECFCHLTYDNELTYEALLEYETTLTATMQELLVILGAEHVDFMPAGDSLYVQWALVQRDDEALTALCDALTAMTGNKAEGRILIVDRKLHSLRHYNVSQGAWQTWDAGWSVPKGLRARANASRCAHLAS